MDKYKRFKNGIYSIKRYTSNVNAYEYVDPPPLSHISNEKQFSSSDKNEIKCVESKEVNYMIYINNNNIFIIIQNYSYSVTKANFHLY